MRTENSVSTRTSRFSSWIHWWSEAIVQTNHNLHLWGNLQGYRSRFRESLLRSSRASKSSFGLTFACYFTPGVSSTWYGVPQDVCLWRRREKQNAGMYPQVTKKAHGVMPWCPTFLRMLPATNIGSSVKFRKYSATKLTFSNFLLVLFCYHPFNRFGQRIEASRDENFEKRALCNRRNGTVIFPRQLFQTNQ